MNLLQFAEKKGYYQNGLLDRPLKEIDKEFKENKANQKKLFIIKDKKKKGYPISYTDEIFYKLIADKIIW